MSETAPEAVTATGSRPKPLHLARSFTRMADQPSPQESPRKRASTLQEAGIPSIPEARHIPTSPEISGKKAMADVFENEEEGEQTGEKDGTSTPGLNVPSTFDELPVEIRSLCDRFLDTLSAKVHDKPVSAEQLSEIFQAFYERAASHIATHIATLAAKIGREASPAQRKASKGRARAGSGARKGSSDDLFGHAEMLTATEVADRKKARRLLEQKRLALEEAVERAICEKVYGRVWQHRSTEDEARDEKLRSRTQSLALVGIGLKELHMDGDPAHVDVRKTAEEREDEINQSLSAARDALQKMDDEHYPLGKLQHLTAAHQSIVETLSQLFPSSSSADEILPTLIYTLITCPAQGVNAVSNLAFIQRFRTSSKVDGEAAYCLVNLEAAISFLETVDLSSLRADELPQGPDAKPSSQPTTPRAETSPSLPQTANANALTPSLSTTPVTSSDVSTSPTPAATTMSAPGKSARPQMQQRRISTLMAQQAERIESGRDNFLNAADKFYDSVNGTLDNSLQFLFGRFKEQVAGSGNSPLPKTLEEARKLVSSPAIGADEDAESLSISGRSSPGVGDDPLSTSGKPADSNNKMLELLGGKRPVKQRSTDSMRSGGSGRRAVTFDSKTSATAASKEKKPDGPPTPSGLFNSINPLNKFGMPAFVPRFGRAGSINTAQPASPVWDNKPSAVPAGAGVAQGRLGDIVESPMAMQKGSERLIPHSPLEKTRSRDSAAGFGESDDLNAREALAELRKLKPPKKRFLEVESSSQLKLGEVEELLLEYRRLAKAIGEAIAN